MFKYCKCFLGGKSIEKKTPQELREYNNACNHKIPKEVAIFTFL